VADMQRNTDKPLGMGQLGNSSKLGGDGLGAFVYNGRADCNNRLKNKNTANIEAVASGQP